MKKRLSFLFSIFQYDVFNHQFFLRIGRKSKNSTYFSMTISHIVLLLLLVYFLFSSFNTFLHTNPQINIQDFDINARPYIHLEENNFHFAFRIEDNNGNPVIIDNIDNYFTIEVTFYAQTHNETAQWQTTDERTYGFVPCQKENFQEFDVYFETNLMQAYCLKNHSFDVGGFWDENQMSYLYITIDICDNETEGCVGAEVFKETFAGNYLTFYLETQNVDGNDYNSPLKKNLKYYSYLLDTDIKKDVNFYIKQVQLKTNDALFFNSVPTVQEFFKQNNVDLDFNSNLNPEDNNTLNAFWEIYIYSSNQVQNIERTYVTLTAVFASVGGIAKFLLILGTFITLYYNEMKLQSELLNELFVFDVDEVSDGKKKRKSFSRTKGIRNHRRTFSSYLDKKNEKMSLSDGNPANRLNLLNFENEKKDYLNLESPNLVFTNLKQEEEENERKINKPKRFSKSLTEKNHLSFLNKEIIVSKPVSLKNVDVNNQILLFVESEQKMDQSFESKNKATTHTFTQRHHTSPNFHTQEITSTNRNLLGNGKNIEMAGIANNENEEDQKAEEDQKEKKIIDDKIKMEMYLDKSLKYVNEAKHSMKNKLQFSFWEIIRSTFFPFFLSKPHQKKLELYNKASNDLLKYINIMELVQMLQQLEKLKVIIFNKEQLALFNFLSKPLITIDNSEDSPTEQPNEDTSGTKVSRMMRYMQGGNMKEQCKDIIQYYNNLIETGGSSEIDKKLFELLDDDFRTIIDRFGSSKRDSYGRR